MMEYKKALLCYTFSLLLFGCGGDNSDSVADDTSSPANPAPEENTDPEQTNAVPTVNAGSDQTVDAEVAVTLSGSATDTDGTITSYSWVQTSGTTVSLNNATSAIASFTSPISSSSEILTFSLTASDNEGSSQTDTTNITVNPGSVAAPPACDEWADNWADLGLKLNGIDVAVDSYNNRLFLSLGDGYYLPQVLPAVIEYEPLCNVGIGFDNGAVVASGTTIDLTNISYGASTVVNLYVSDPGGMVSENYDMVFTNLPVIELAAELIVDEPKYPGTFKLTSALFDQYTGTMNMGIETRGGTSQIYEKKSFSIELVEDDDPEEERKLALLDLRKDGDWILDATYRDTTFVRNITSMDIYNEMRPYAYIDVDGNPQGQAAIKGHQVEVILDGRYRGVFILEEKVDRKLLDMEKINVSEDAEGNELWDEVDYSQPENGSVLYKASSNTADLYYYSDDDVKNDFEQKYPKIDDIEHYGPLLDLVGFLNDSSDEQFAERIRSDDFIDLDSAVDFWIMSNLTQNRDTFNKNYYIARNMMQKWFFVPWDNDATFGMHWNGAPFEYVDWWAPDTNKLIQRLVNNPGTGFNSLVKARWQQLRATIFTTEALTARFVKYRKISVPISGVSENARERNFTRWPESGGEGVNNPEVGSIDYIEDWIERRINFLDVQIMSQAE